MRVACSQRCSPKGATCTLDLGMVRARRDRRPTSRAICSVRLQDLEDAREGEGQGRHRARQLGLDAASRVVGVQGRRPAAARGPLGQRKRRFRRARFDRREPSPRHSRSISRSGGAPKARGARRRTSRREPRDRHVVGWHRDARRFERGAHGAVAGRGRSRRSHGSRCAWAPGAPRKAADAGVAGERHRARVAHRSVPRIGRREDRRRVVGRAVPCCSGRASRVRSSGARRATRGERSRRASGRAPCQQGAGSGNRDVRGGRSFSSDSR